MELKIITKQEKPLLSRTEIITEITFDAATPKKEEIKDKLATLLKSDSNLTVIKKVDTIFGEKKAQVLAFVYTNEKDMKRIEPKPKVKKPKEAKAPKEEKPREPKKEEAQKEKKKEQPKEKKRRS